jgi:hypothetical protein
MRIQVFRVVLSGRVIDSGCPLKMLGINNLATVCNNPEDLNPQHEHNGSLKSQTCGMVHNQPFIYIAFVLAPVNCHRWQAWLFYSAGLI